MSDVLRNALVVWSWATAVSGGALLLVMAVQKVARTVAGALAPRAAHEPYPASPTAPSWTAAEPPRPRRSEVSLSR